MLSRVNGHKVAKHVALSNTPSIESRLGHGRLGVIFPTVLIVCGAGSQILRFCAICGRPRIGACARSSLVRAKTPSDLNSTSSRLGNSAHRVQGRKPHENATLDSKSTTCEGLRGMCWARVSRDRTTSCGSLGAGIEDSTAAVTCGSRRPNLTQNWSSHGRALSENDLNIPETTQRDATSN